MHERRSGYLRMQDELLPYLAEKEFSYKISISDLLLLSLQSSLRIFFQQKIVDLILSRTGHKLLYLKRVGGLDHTHAIDTCDRLHL